MLRTVASLKFPCSALEQSQEIQKHSATMDRLAGVLYAYVLNWIKNRTELPIEVCTSTCLESLKAPHKIEASIKALQQKYNKIIKDFDTS